MLGLAFCTLPKEDHFLLPLVYSGLEGPLVPWSQSHSGIRVLSIGQVTPPSKLSPRCGPTLGSAARASHAPVTRHLSPVTVAAEGTSAASAFAVGRLPASLAPR